jgi:hypothetical protein
MSSTSSSSSAQEVDNQNHQAHDQEQVNQTAANVQTETQKPQDQENNKDRPKHGNLLFHKRDGNLKPHARTCFARTDERTSLTVDCFL